MKYRATQYLIGKVSDMVKVSQEGSIVTALLASVLKSDNLLHEWGFFDSQSVTTVIKD